MSTVAERERRVGVTPHPRPVALTHYTRRALLYLVMIAGALVLLFPLYWLVSTSLKATDEIDVFPPIWVPSHLLWQNYVTLFETVPFWTYLKNSLLVTLTSVVGTVFSSALVGFSFAAVTA